jgi:uncharacterized protein YraI
MQYKPAILIAAVTAAALSSPASAASFATATTALNIRSGPGPQYSVVGAIPDHAQATITGCIQGSLWCAVSYNGKQGWAYAQYMETHLSGRSLILAEHLGDVAPVTYAAPVETVGSAVPAPAVTGALVEAPAAPAPLSLTPPPAVGDYVINHPLAPVYLNGEVVQGAGVPEAVALAPVPGSNYSYAYVNSVPVLVEPATRQVVYVYR